MTDILRLTFMMAVLLLVALAAALEQPEWARDLGLERWNVATLTCFLNGQPTFTSEELACQQAVLGRIQTKQAIVKNLIDGRITLFEAAALFRRLEENIPVSLSSYPTYPGDSEEERLCYQVIQWTKVELTTTYSCLTPDDFLRQLEEELRRHKARHGTVRLPETSGTL